MHVRLVVLASGLVALLCAVIITVPVVVTHRRYGPTNGTTTNGTCNGHVELCNRSYGNITFIGAHDSYAFSNNTLQLARDQEVDIPTQLSFGIRLLQAQSHMYNNLLFDGGTVADYLTLVRTFLDNNPNDVLTLLFTNPEGWSFNQTWAPLFENASLSNYAYVPPQNPMPQNAWPTLGNMIASGKRLVVFIDYLGNDSTTVDYLLPEFGMIWETPYDVTDPAFNCSIDRIRGTLSATDQMYLINHYLDLNVLDLGILISDVEDAPTTNSVSSIVANADNCVPLANGRYPNFVLIDWINIGDAFKAGDQLNGLS
ncbi:PLC-like phosphodiesterase [Russula dissimulans]|nr:PLC-like phosphodiesterase [Russula dissimulans]